MTEKRNAPTKILAISGTVILWLPIIFMLITSVFGTVYARRFRMDFLIPAELFPIELLGALLLLWAAWRAHLNRKSVGFGLVAALVFLVGSQVIAVISGLASGKVEPTGWIFVIVIAILALFVLSIIEIGISGILMIRMLYRKV